MKRIAILGSALVVALLAPAPASAQVVSPSVCPDSETQAAELTPARMDAAMFCLSNAVRAANGLAPLTESPRLKVAAIGHSTDMIARGYFTHDSLDGRHFDERIAVSGYLGRARAWLVGENLAWGSGARSTPLSLMQAWWNSPPHRANLLRVRFKQVGIGSAVGTPYDSTALNGMTVTADYGARWGRKGRPRVRRHSHR